MHRRQKLILEQKPKELNGIEKIGQKEWKKYQNHLKRVSPIERAEKYQEILNRPGVGTITRVAQITGEKRQSVSRIMQLLKLPESIKKFLRQNQTPAFSRYFTERQLHQLVKSDDASAQFAEFKSMLRGFEENACISVKQCVQRHW